MKTVSKLFFALLVVATLSLCIQTSSFAQTTTSIGIKGGINLATFRGSDQTIKDANNRTGFNIGALLNYSVAEKAGLSLEVDYASMGATFKTAGIETVNKLDYLRTTLLFDYFMGTQEMTIRPKLFAGPYVGFLLNSQDKVGNGKYADTPDGVFKGTDFGAVFGAGLHVKLAEKVWLVPDVRYNLGLSNIYDTNNFAARNGVLSVNLGLTFPLN